MILQINKLTKQYKHKDGIVDALKDVTFSVNKNAFVTITGPSGSGKSTLLLSLFGLIRLSSGEVLYENKRIDNVKDNVLTALRKMKVGYIMQNFALIPYLTTIQNVMIPLCLQKIKKTEQYILTKEVLNFVGLSNRINHLPKELSIGQQQRVAIARALVHNPSIILADEPTGNLDPALSLEILDFLKKINQEKEITIIMVTHSPLAADYGNQKIQLKNGQIVSSN